MERQECPRVITQTLEKSKRQSLWAKVYPFIGEATPQEHCAGIKPMSEAISSGVAFERFLEIHTNFALSSRAQLSEQQCLHRGSSQDQINLVGLHYVSSQRLRQGLREDIQSLLNIDHTLGVQNLAREVKCNQLPESVLVGECLQMRKCSPVAYSLDEMTERGLVGLRLIEEKQKKIAELANHLRRGPQSNEDAQLIEKLKKEIEEIYRLYPWLRGDAVSKNQSRLLKMKDDAAFRAVFKEHLTKDLKTTRAQILKKFEDEKRAAQCLLKNSVDLKCDDFMKIVAQAPPLDLSSFEKKLSHHELMKLDPEKKDLFQKGIVANTKLAEAQCLIDLTQKREEAVTDLQMAALDAGVTLGLALTPYGIVRAGLMGRRAKVAGLAINGVVDTTYATYGVSEAYRQCQPQVERISSRSDSASKVEPTSFADEGTFFSSAGGEGQCQPPSVDLVAHREVESCMLGVLAGAGSLVPLGTLAHASSRFGSRAVPLGSRAAPDASSSSTTSTKVKSRVEDIVRSEKADSLDELVQRHYQLTDSERRAKIKEIFPEFSDEQVEAVMKAHNVKASGPEGRYSVSDLREKSKIMQKANVGAEERQIIERLGLAGSGDSRGSLSGIGQRLRGPPYRPNHMSLGKNEFVVGDRVYSTAEDILIPRTGGGYSVGRIVEAADQPGKVNVEFLSPDGQQRLGKTVDVSALRRAKDPSGMPGWSPVGENEFLARDGTIFRKNSRVLIEVESGRWREATIQGHGVSPDEFVVSYSNNTSSVGSASFTTTVSREKIFSPFRAGDEVFIPGRQGDGVRKAKIMKIHDDGSADVIIPEGYGEGRVGVKRVHRDQMSYMEPEKATGGAPSAAHLESKARSAVQSDVSRVRSDLSENRNRKRFMDGWKKKMDANPSDLRAKEKYETLNRAYLQTRERMYKDVEQLYRKYQHEGGQMSVEDFLDSIRSDGKW